jgi:hypothetical protein
MASELKASKTEYAKARLLVNRGRPAPAVKVRRGDFDAVAPADAAEAGGRLRR